LAAELEQPARAALGWICAALDRDGYLTYPTDGSGLRNQCWKDSSASICFPDGTPAEGPIAVCEAQGYTYDALVRCAVLAREVWGDAALATSLDDRAARLRERFLDDFWLSGDGFVALALDGDRRPLPTITSNPGHVLWSGVLDAERASAVGRRLLVPDLFNGWGIRTLAAGQPAYHPLSYHNGSVWPHDTAIAVAGLARYGMRDEARAVASGLLAAATSDGGRLPELIAGYGREERSSPVPYPHSCSPQAWAAAAPLLLRSALQCRSPY
jgi:glycogen debranching enzyme